LDDTVAKSHDLDGVLDQDKQANVDLRVQLSAPRTLYVGFDGLLPPWLESWELMADRTLSTTDTDMRVYRASFPADEVALGSTGFTSG
jgi:hypothetical protein